MLALLASCGTTEPAVETTAKAGPGFPAGSAGWNAKEREAYHAAFVAGQRDQREGYRYDDDRVTLPLGQELRSFARQGYRGGYYQDTAARQARRSAAAAAPSTDAPSPLNDFSIPSSAAPAAVPPGAVSAPPRSQAPAKSRGPDPFSVPLEPEAGDGGSR